MKPPKDCMTMQELRAQIDALDSRIVETIALRARYIDRAAELKPGEGMPARIEDRVEAVVGSVRQKAKAMALDPDLVEGMWRMMIDWSIAREEKVLGKSPEEEAR